MDEPKRFESHVYKLLERADWESIEGQAEWDGSEVDRRDGFIHFSAADQVAETLRKHFATASELVLLSVSTSTVSLTWEPSRGGALFPHLYGPLPLGAIDRVEHLPRGPSGHELPPTLGLDSQRRE
ncbi:MAG: DUF952 domain-containing protein [Deltaproteobacteria bacterium]|nr:MAG: DUF952 domain-containing protein [Deltaproteobacteria bacterium]